MISITDVRHAFRHLRQSPGYAATAILTFALAIGANSAIFSAVNTVLLRPLPVDAPGNLAVVWQTDAGGQAVIELTHRHLREWDDGRTDVHAGRDHGIAQLERGPAGTRRAVAHLVQRRVGRVLRHARRAARCSDARCAPKTTCRTRPRSRC